MEPGSRSLAGDLRDACTKRLAWLWTSNAEHAASFSRSFLSLWRTYLDGAFNPRSSGNLEPCCLILARSLGLYGVHTFMTLSCPVVHPFSSAKSGLAPHEGTQFQCDSRTTTRTDGIDGNPHHMGELEALYNID